MDAFGSETTSCVVYASPWADVVENEARKVHKTKTANRCSPLQNALGCFKLKIHLSGASFPGEEFGCSMVQIITPWMQRAD